MNKIFIEFFKKLEETVGTRKLMKCMGGAVINFVLLLMIIPDDAKQEVMEILNNKEEK